MTTFACDRTTIRKLIGRLWASDPTFKLRMHLRFKGTDYDSKKPDANIPLITEVMTSDFTLLVEGHMLPIASDDLDEKGWWRPPNHWAEDVAKTPPEFHYLGKHIQANFEKWIGKTAPATIPSDQNGVLMQSENDDPTKANVQVNWERFDEGAKKRIKEKIFLLGAHYKLLMKLYDMSDNMTFRVLNGDKKNGPPCRVFIIPIINEVPVGMFEPIYPKQVQMEIDDFLEEKEKEVNRKLNDEGRK